MSPIRIALLCALCALMAGCVACGARSVSTSAAEPPSPDPTLMASPSPTPFYINPLDEFYTHYEAAVDSNLDLLSKALSDMAASPKALEALFALTEHRVRLSEVSVSMARLFPDGDTAGALSYSGSLTGAAGGYGSMKGDAGGIYALDFSFDDGRALHGTYAAGVKIEFCVYAAPAESPDADANASSPAAYGAELFSCKIERTADGWTTTVLCDGAETQIAIGETTRFAYGATVLEFDGQQVLFGEAPIEATATPG